MTAWLIRQKNKKQNKTKQKKENKKIFKEGILSISVAALLAGFTSTIC